jgi:hypothetical protein
MLVDANDLTSNARGNSSGYRGMGCRVRVEYFGPAHMLGRML